MARIVDGVVVQNAKPYWEDYWKRQPEEDVLKFSTKWTKPRFVHLMNEILKQCKGKTLDVGCGKGEFTFIYRNAEGIDMHYFEEWGADKRFKVKSIHEVDTKGYDTILFNNSFENMGDWDKILERTSKINPVHVFALPRIRHVLHSWSRIPINVIKKAVGANNENIKYLISHDFSRYGFNVFWLIKDYLSWEQLFEKYFDKIVIIPCEDYNIFVCTKKKAL